MENSHNFNFSKNQHKLFTHKEIFVKTLDTDNLKLKNTFSQTSDDLRKTPSFKTYFDFGYYMCVTPFRFKLNVDGTGYTIHKNLFQQVICGIKHFLTVVETIAHLRQKVGKSRDPLVIYYFDVIESVIMIPYHLTFFSTLWFLQGKISELINQSVQYSAYFGHRKSILNMTVVLCTFASAMGFLSTISQTGIAEASEKPLSAILAKYVQTAKFNLFLVDNATLLNSNSSLITENTHPSLGAIDLVATAFELFSDLSSQFSDAFASISLVLAAVTLLQATKSFTKTLSNDANDRSKVMPILEHFYKLKTFSNALNGFIAPTLFVYCIVSISYFSVNLDAFVGEERWLDKFYVVYYIINDGAMFFISGLVCQEMNKFLTWLLRRETRKILTPEEMTVLLADVTSNPVGISGNGKFTIDNKFIGNIGITLITLFVIVLQVRK